MTTNVPDFVSELLQDDLKDQTAVADFKYEIPEKGEVFGRLVSYIELGTHERKPFAGKPKTPCRKVRVVFEVLSPKYVKEIEVDGIKRKIAPLMGLTMDVIANDKAKFYKLLMRLREAVPAKATKTNMAYFLNEAVKFRITHDVKDPGTPKEKTFANIDLDSICEPMGTTTDGDVMVVTVQPAISPIRLFLFDRPTKATWDSIFIDGERTVKDAAGAETKQSKNTLQAQILGANDFQGSAVEALLVSGDFPDITAMTAEADIVEDDEAPVETKPAKAPKAAATTKSAADAMADLGLVG